MNHITSFLRQVFVPSGLTTGQLKRLSEHKYSASDVSFLDELCMKRFWDEVVLKVPLWVAPNLITIVGLLCNVVATLTLAAYVPDGTGEAPRWAYFLCGINLFIYQTLDAIDGKQARRTGTASPLGELFDHGCDSLSQIFVTLETALCLQLGKQPELFLYSCVLSLFLFYLAHWQTYVCGMLKFTRFDVTEAQFLVIMACFLTGLFGPRMWQESALLGYPLAVWFIIISTLAFFMQSYKYFHTIFTGGVGKHGSTVAGTSVLFPIIPISIPLIACVTIYARSTTPDLDKHLVLYVVLFGMVCSKITNGLVVAHMSRSEMATWDTIFMGPFLLFFNQYWGTVFSEYAVLWLAIALCAANYAAYSYVVITQLCELLRIECFRIRPQ